MVIKEKWILGLCFSRLKYAVVDNDWDVQQLIREDRKYYKYYKRLNKISQRCKWGLL